MPPTKFEMPARTDLPGKEIAESTYKAYKTELNRFARLGLTTPEELLSQQDAVIKIIKESEFTSQQKKVQISAVLKVLGHVKGAQLTPLKDYLDTFFFVMQEKLDPQSQAELLKIYNRIFNQHKPPTSCTPCWISILEELKVAHNQYKI